MTHYLTYGKGLAGRDCEIVARIPPEWNRPYTAKLDVRVIINGKRVIRRVYVGQVAPKEETK